MIRVAEATLVVFAALMGFDRPSPPVRAHAAWADAAMLVCAVLTGLAAVSGRLRPSTARGAGWAAIAYVAWAAVSAALHGGMMKVVGIAELACVLVCTATLGREASLRARVLRAWIGGAAVLALVGLVAGILAQAGVRVRAFHTGAGELGWMFRPAGLQRVGLLAALLVVPLLACVASGQHLVGRWRTTLIALFSATLLVGATRSILAAALGVLVLRARRHVAIAGSGVLLLIALGSVVLDVHMTGELGVRARIWRAAAATIAAQPVTGVGPDAAVAVVGWPRAADPPVAWDAHNTLLDVAAQLGLPALIAFGVVLACIARRAPPGLYRAALLATCLDAVTLDIEDFRHVWLLLGLAAAAGLSNESPGAAPTTSDSSSV